MNLKQYFKLVFIYIFLGITCAEKGRKELVRITSIKFWEIYARISAWWQTDVYGWVMNVPCSDSNGKHCKGRRTNKDVYCKECDGPKQ